jgi:hypothetical protein
MHESMKPLADLDTQDQFLAYLWDLNPQAPQLRSKEFWVRQWVAFKKDEYLKAPGGTATAEQLAKAADLKRKASGVPMPGSRPSAPPQEPRSALDEMVDEHLAHAAGR